MLSRYALCAALALGACKDLTPLSPQAQLNLCRAEALAPIVGTLDAAIAVVRDVNAGRIGLPEVLAQAGATQAQVLELVQALEACEADAPDAPAPASAAKEEVL